MFFFEKKNQKTFICCAVPEALPSAENATMREPEESLFASFSTEKEGLLRY
jgi:hypothetical protein